MREKDIEQQFAREVKKYGGIAPKFVSPGFSGMPELIESRYEVHMSKTEARRYDIMKNELILQLDGENITAANAAALSNKLSQMANGAIYSDDYIPIKIHDKKLDALEDIIEAANGKPILVAY